MTCRLWWKPTPMLVDGRRGNCDEDLAEVSRAEAEQIAAELAAGSCPPDAARLPWVASANPDWHLVDPAYYEDLAGRLYGLVIRLSDRLSADQAQRRLASAGADKTVRLWDSKATGALSLLRLDAPIEALTWRREAIALGNGTSIVLLDVVTHK
jgi:hypothetical protein